MLFFTASCRAGFYNSVSGESRGLVTADSRGNIHLVFARSTNKYLLVVEGPIGTSPQRGRWKEHAVALSRQYPIPPGELPPPCLVVKLDLKTDGGPVPGH